MRFIIDGAARATQLQSGEAHIAKSLPVANLATLEGDASLEIHQLELTRTTVMLLNNSQPPFDDPLVRQAIQSAVDTQAIVDGVYEGSGVPAVGPFGPDTAWAPEGAEAVAVDLDEARSLLDEAGVDPESLSIELMAYNDRPEFGDVAAVIQSELGELGVDVKIKGGDYAALEPDLLSGNFDATLLSRGYLVDVADPGGYLRLGLGLRRRLQHRPLLRPRDRPARSRLQRPSRTQKSATLPTRLLPRSCRSRRPASSRIHESAVWGSAVRRRGFQPHPLDQYALTADLSVG